MSDLVFPDTGLTPGDVYERWQWNGRAWDPLSPTPYVPLAGNVAMTGPIYYTGPFVLGTSLVNKDYVDQAVSQLQVFEGAWDAATNTPDLTLVAVPTNGSYYIASSAGTAPAALPGIGGQTVRPGDMVVWQTGPPAEWAIIPGAGMTQAEADVRYLQLAGGTLTGTLTLAGNAAAAPGGNLQPVPLQQLNAALTDYVLKAGDTMTGSLTISPNTSNLFARGYAQVGTPTGAALTTVGSLNVQNGYYVNGVSIGTGPFLPLVGGALAGPGNLTAAGTLGVTGTSLFTGSAQFQNAVEVARLSGGLTVGFGGNNTGATLTVLGGSDLATLAGAVNVGSTTNNTAAVLTVMGATVLDRISGGTTIGSTTNNPNPLLQSLGYIRAGTPTGTAVTTQGSVNVADFYYRNGQTIGSAWELMTYTPATGFTANGVGILIRLNRVFRCIAIYCEGYTVPDTLNSPGTRMGTITFPTGFATNGTKRAYMVAESTLAGVGTGRTPINLDLLTNGQLNVIIIQQDVLGQAATGMTGVRLFGNFTVWLDA